jgi:hypothetical protein
MRAERRVSIMRIILLAGIVGPMLIGGCANVPHTEAKLDNFATCDAEVIAKVEREARRRGSEISWLRCPQLSPERALPPFHYGDRRDV